MEDKHLPDGLEGVVGPPLAGRVGNCAIQVVKSEDTKVDVEQVFLEVFWVEGGGVHDSKRMVTDCRNERLPQSQKNPETGIAVVLGTHQQVRLKLRVALILEKRVLIISVWRTLNNVLGIPSFYCSSDIVKQRTDRAWVWILFMEEKPL